MAEVRTRLMYAARTTNGIDLVLADPPWPNKSASRSAAYETFDPYSLFDFDLRSVLEASFERDERPRRTLVGVWTTNKPKFRSFVIDKLFPAWSLSHHTTFTWIKVAANGEPVYPLDGSGRRCYEGGTSA